MIVIAKKQEKNKVKEPKVQNQKKIFGFIHLILQMSNELIYEGKPLVQFYKWTN